MAALLHAGLAVAALLLLGRAVPPATDAPPVIELTLLPAPPALAAAVAPPKDHAEAPPPAPAPRAAEPPPEPEPEPTPMPKPAPPQPVIRPKPAHRAAAQPAATPVQATPAPATPIPATPIPAAPVSAAPAPAAPAPAPAAAPPDYGPVLHAWLQHFRDYPAAARLRRQQGSLRLALTLDASGRLLDLRLESTSGFALLDRAALEMARRADPYPPPQLPPGTVRATFVVPVQYSLEASSGTPSPSSDR